MNEQNHDPFDILFQRARVDLPDHLKRRLLTIPSTAPSISFWDFRSWLPIIAVIPGIFWLLITYSAPLWQWLGTKIVGLVSAWPSVDSTSIPNSTLYIALGGITISVLAGAWLLLRQGQRAQISYAKQLTAAG